MTIIRRSYSVNETVIHLHILRAILIGFALLGGVYSVIVPIFEASDEVWHYPMVQHIANHWTLPVQPLEPGKSSGPWRQEGSQPPLYYALCAALTAWIDTGDMEQVRHLNPYVAAGEIRADRSNPNLVVHNPMLERFPWRGTVLAVYIARFCSVLLGTWAVYLTWALVRELFPVRPWIALAAAGVHAFTPMVVFISASVNNDNLIVPLCTLTLLYMVRLIKGPAVAGSGSAAALAFDHLILGGILGMGLLTKASAIGLLPLVGATVFWEAWRLPKTHTFFQRVIFFVEHIALVFLAAFLISGWWYYRNYRLYGDWLGLNAFYAVLGVRDVAANFSQLWAERFAFAAGYWGNFGGLNVPMSGWIYTGLNGIALLAIAGVGMRFVKWLFTPRPLELPRSGDLRRTREFVGRTSSVGRGLPTEAPARIVRKLWPFCWDDLTAARALAWAWPAAVFVSWIRWATITWSSQGRLIFSALPLWSLALVLGVTAWVPASRSFELPRSGDFRRTGKLELRQLTLAPMLSAALVAGLFVLSLIAPFAWIRPAYVPPSPLTGLVRGDIPNSVSVLFGDPSDSSGSATLKLLGYAIDTQALRPGAAVKLTLYWEALAPTATDHALFVHLLGEGDRIVAQRDSFPGRGLLSTTWLTPGQTWAERTIIPTPPMAYAPDTLRVSLGIYEVATGERLVVYTPDGQSPPDELRDTDGETVRFGDIALRPNEGDIPNPVYIRFGEGMALVGYDLSSIALDAGEPLTVRMYWQREAREAPIDENYTISVQLIDAQWRKAGQSDAQPQNGLAPTSEWEVGERVIDQRVLSIAPDVLHPNVYDVRIAVYTLDAEGEIQHLPVVWQVGQMPAQAVTLTRVRIW
jgi:4-amino-4-deoxy-L-arabinose transferase-like glycosyltransferase